MLLVFIIAFSFTFEVNLFLMKIIVLILMRFKIFIRKVMIDDNFSFAQLLNHELFIKVIFFNDSIN